MLFSPVVCADGFKMSIQASASHYCAPRQDDSPLYSSVEVYTFPESGREPLLQGYFDSVCSEGGRVHGWVPARKVFAIIRKHGGVVSGDHPPMATNTPI